MRTGIQCVRAFFQINFTNLQLFSIYSNQAKLQRSRRIVLLLVSGLVIALFWRSLPNEPATPFFSQPQSRSFVPSEARYSSQFVSHRETPSVHSATAVELTDGVIQAFWYGGTREGAKDVAIYSARFDPAAVIWSKPELLVDRSTAQRALHRTIRKIGNPVIYKATDKQLWLFYVSVSVGGWAGSSINLKISNDLGKSWQPARRLVTSPFLNISTLVKGPAFKYQDGTVGLPVYHEFIGKFGELLRLDKDGVLLDKLRLSHGRTSLQPVITPIDDLHAAGFMRYAGEHPRRLLYFNSTDGGAIWSSPQKSSLPNPNAAVSVLKLASGDLLMVFNNSEKERNDLTLAVSKNQGLDWLIVMTVEQEVSDPASHEFSYPWLLQSEDGNTHLLYTWNKTQIKHVLFNTVWLEQQVSRLLEN